MTELAIIVIMALVAYGMLKGRGKTAGASKASTMPDPKTFQHFEAVPSMFVNKAEQAFFYSLRTAFPPQCHILVKPRLEDVIRVRRDLSDKKLAWRLRGRVKSRHVDYVVMDGWGRPLLAIELDGKSHTSKSAKAGDTLKDGIFQAANVPLHRVLTGQNFDARAQEIARSLVWS